VRFNPLPLAIALAMVSIFAIYSVSARSVGLRTIKESYIRADEVALVHIRKVESIEVGDTRCGMYYRATILKSFKSVSNSEIASSRKKIAFGRGEGLAVDQVACPRFG